MFKRGDVLRMVEAQIFHENYQDPRNMKECRDPLSELPLALFIQESSKWEMHLPVKETAKKEKERRLGRVNAEGNSCEESIARAAIRVPSKILLPPGS